MRLVMGAGLCGRCSRFLFASFLISYLSILFTVCNISIKKKKERLLYTQDVE